MGLSHPREEGGEEEEEEEGEEEEEAAARPRITRLWIPPRWPPRGCARAPPFLIRASPSCISPLSLPQAPWRVAAGMASAL